MPPKKLIRKSRGKRKNQIKHFSKRCKERLGLDVNDNQYTQIINKIQKGRAKLIRKQSNTRTIWEIMFEGKLIKVVYDKKRKTAVTTFPLNGSISISEVIGERSLS